MPVTAANAKQHFPIPKYHQATNRFRKHTAGRQGAKHRAKQIFLVPEVQYATSNTAGIRHRRIRKEQHRGKLARKPLHEKSQYVFQHIETDRHTKHVKERIEKNVLVG